MNNKGKPKSSTIFAVTSHFKINFIKYICNDCSNLIQILNSSRREHTELLKSLKYNHKRITMARTKAK